MNSSKFLDASYKFFDGIQHFFIFVAHKLGWCLIIFICCFPIFLPILLEPDCVEPFERSSKFDFCYHVLPVKVVDFFARKQRSFALKLEHKVNENIYKLSDIIINNASAVDIHAGQYADKCANDSKATGDNYYFEGTKFQFWLSAFIGFLGGVLIFIPLGFVLSKVIKFIT